jgi:hypothetical protein
MPKAEVDRQLSHRMQRIATALGKPGSLLPL